MPFSRHRVTPPELLVRAGLDLRLDLQAEPANCPSRLDGFCESTKALNIFVVRSTGLTGVPRDSIAWPWMSGVATLHAAPGAGKTLFAGAVFQKLRDAGHVDRLIVVMPNVAIVEQWKVALGGLRIHLDTEPGDGFLAQIRRDHQQQGLSVRALAKRYGVHRRTVRQALEDAVPPPRKMPGRRAPKLEGVKAIVDGWLREDLDAPPKQRHTAQRIWQRLVDEHHVVDLSYSTVRDYVARRRPEVALERDDLVWDGACVPQSHLPGRDAEVDGHVGAASGRGHLPSPRSKSQQVLRNPGPKQFYRLLFPVTPQPATPEEEESCPTTTARRLRR